MAIISKVRIANMALSNVGAKSTIELLTEDSAEAQSVDLWYEYSRMQTLEAHNWSFARKRLILADHSEDPPDGIWAYRYQYPSDCIRMREIQQATNIDSDDAVPFSIEVDANKNDKTILTDMQSAIGVYTFDLQTTALMSPLFVEAFAAMLSYHIAFALTSDMAIQTQMLEKFSSLMALAPMTDANEQVQKAPRDAEWIRGR